MTDLRPNKDLINNTFDGYKLAKDDLEILQVALITPVNGIKWKQTQYSYALVKSHEMYNHLYRDPCSNKIYYADENFAVNLLQEDGSSSSFDEVFKIPKLNEELKDSAFSESIIFPSAELAVICDGNGKVYLINTGSRDQKQQTWHVINENSLHDIKSPALLLSATMDTNVLHVLTMSFKDVKHEDETVTKVCLHWLQVNISVTDMSECGVKGMKVFLGKSVPYAHWFSQDFSFFYAAAENPFHLVDSETFDKIEPLVPLENENSTNKYYRWHQSKEIITVTFDFHVTDKEVDVQLQFNNICVKLTNGKVLLSGDLEHDVIVDASKWFVEKNRLVVNLVKKEAGPFWLGILKGGDQNGVHDIMGEEEENINYVNESLAHLTSDGNIKEEKESNFNMQQLEECDQNMDDDIKLFSLNVFTGKILTQKNFSGHQWLFTKQNKLNDAPLICLRHDVDGILWQPSRNPTENWLHTATFDALGYVQASKTNHKFTACNESFKYAFITDCSSHVYIYEAETENKKQHKQYVKGFSDSEKILGCQSVGKKIYVLTDKHLNIIQLS